MTSADASTLEPAQARSVAEGFRLAMRKLAAAICLISTSEDDQPHGMAATAVVSLTVDPPALLICVNRSASIHQPLQRTGRFCVNVLADAHGALVQAFSGGLKGAARFEVGDWRRDETGLPYLEDACSNVFCTVEQTATYGTHTVYIGRVDSVRANAGKRTLLHHEGVAGRFLVMRANSPQDWPIERLGNVIFPVRDMGRAVAFYGDVLGLKPRFRDGDGWAAFDLDGVTIALEASEAPAAAGGPVISLRCHADFKAAVAELKRRGADVGPIERGGHELKCVLTDPDGNQLVLYAPLPK